ncbi:MAG: serine/threonine-protein kinase, partial [Vicinamibacterales bacterium]
MAAADPKGASHAAAWTPQSQETTPASPSAQVTDRFVPGVVFAGRYRMVTRVGQGGMGEVWQADDLVLETPVAIKLVRASSDEQRARLLREVRLARQITHSGVCRVFDAGESEGIVFYSMEFVDGEDLATLIRRAGRLTPNRAVDVTRELCDAVAAAHAQGVLHRDLKPANVLVDRNGAIRITDFGIAVARSEARPHTLIGTPGYMAPEQVVAGAAISERTDVYAIGLIMYELLVGHGPTSSDGASRPLPPSALVPGIDATLDSVVMKAIARDPRNRHASPVAMAACLAGTVEDATQRRTVLPWVAALGLAAAVAVLALLSSFVGRRAVPVLTDQDTIVLADFINATGEPVFDGTLKVALAVALEQSPFLRIFPDDSVRDTLRLMERRPEETVTRALAREIAQRERLKALVAGSISSLGTHYAIALEAVNAETGDVMAREQVEATSKEHVLASLGRATSKLREQLGESLRSVQRFDTPLARATTGSLEALHAYSLALDDGRVAFRVEAIPHLRRAIELDPDFALAHAQLSGIYANTNQAQQARPHAQKAFELRDRVSERERYFVSWRYYVDALQAWSKALDLAIEWTASYPREAFAFNSLGLAAGTLGQQVRAEQAYREARRLDPRFVPPHRNLAVTLMWQGKFTEALEAINQARQGGANTTGMRQIEFLSAFVLGDRPRMDAAWRDLRAEEQMFAVNARARAVLFSGRFGASHELYQEAVDQARRAALPQMAAGWLVEDAESHALVGDCATARRESSDGLSLSRDNFALERTSRLLALCGDQQAASAIVSELESRFSDATLSMRLLVPVTKAVAALDRGQADRARDLLGPVQPYDVTSAGEFWPPYVRGLALLQLEDGAAAATQFRLVIDHRGIAPTSPLFALAHIGLGRAELRQGHRAEARAAYERFL